MLVPPSLVLILLSDAMLSAHTIAVTATGRTDRVINTQDIFHAALLPGGIFLVLCLALSWIAGRQRGATAGARAADGRGRACWRRSRWRFCSCCSAASRSAISMRSRRPRWAPSRCWRPASSRDVCAAKR